MEDIMKVESVELIEVDSFMVYRIKSIIYITFNSTETVIKGDYFQVTVRDRTVYFQVAEIKINGDLLKVKAKEFNWFWSEGIDLRQIKGNEVIPVVNEDKIKEINERSRFD